MYENDDEPPETFLLDTNVVSETITKHPDPNVMEWLDVWGISQTFISVMTIGEIRKGINLMERSKKRIALESWLNRDLYAAYKGRILPVDDKVADYWGRIMAEYKNHSNPIDMFFAAAALVHNMTLVTRNEKHFRIRDLRVMNPWTM